MRAELDFKPGILRWLLYCQRWRLEQKASSSLWSSPYKPNLTSLLFSFLPPLMFHLPVLPLSLLPSALFSVLRHGGADNEWSARSKAVSYT